MKFIGLRWHVRVFILLVLSCMMACTWFDFSTKSQSDASQEKSTPLLQKFPQNPDLSDVIRLTYQADQIVREAWWVLTQEKLNSGRSPFGKIMRAATQERQGKLASKGLFACDRYQTTTSKKLTVSFDFSEACQGSTLKKPFAHWGFRGKADAVVEFFPQQLGDILGMSSEIFARKISCDLSWNERRVLDLMKCADWEQDHKENRIRLSEFRYSREGGEILVLRGVVLSGIETVRKIESTVPLAGKIIVTEVVTKAPESEEPEPAAPAPEAKGGKHEAHQSLPAGAVSLDQAPPRFQPKEDPDILRHRQYRFEEEVMDEELNQSVESGAVPENAPASGSVEDDVKTNSPNEVPADGVQSGQVPGEGLESESEVAPEAKVRPESVEKRGR